jgi:Ino eighty subunit 1
MLTREDIQYDFLDAVFSNTKRVFTDQKPESSNRKVTFCELYITALSQSEKCSRVQRDKMRETPAFALELAKISLLVNVGRINTTMACTFAFSYAYENKISISACKKIANELRYV